MRVVFIKPNGRESLAGEAEILFDEGPLDGMKLVGLMIWQGAEQGEYHVSFPGQSFGFGEGRRFFEYLTSQEHGPDVTRRVTDWVLDAFKQSGIPR